MYNNGLSFIYYVLVILTVFNVMTLFIWFSITNLIRITSSATISLDPSNTASITNLSGSGNGTQGKIEFTTGIGPSGIVGAHLAITVGLPSNTSNYEAAVVCMTVTDNTTNTTTPGITLNFPVIKQSINSFTFTNGNPLNPQTTYILSYVVVTV